MAPTHVVCPRCGEDNEFLIPNLGIGNTRRTCIACLVELTLHFRGGRMVACAPADWQTPAQQPLKSSRLFGTFPGW